MLVSDPLIGEEISSIVYKITNILKKHSVVADHIDDAFSFQLIEYSRVPEAVFKAVLEGCLKKKCLSFTYYSPATEEKSERTVEPYHLFNYMGTWHIIGYCHLRKDIRDSALSRISETEVLTELFKIPTDFDFKKYFLSTLSLYKARSTKEVTLRFKPEKSLPQVRHRKSRTLPLLRVQYAPLETTLPKPFLPYCLHLGLGQAISKYFGLGPRFFFALLAILSSSHRRGYHE